MSINEYDRIFKENIEPVLLPFAQKVLGLERAKYTSIKDDLHVTIEREPDFLKRVKEEGHVNNYILQIEFQSIDDPEMVYRMLEYRAILLRKYHCEIRQVVFYIGQNSMKKMTKSLLMNDLSFEYKIVDIRSFDYELFLDSSIPEEVLLAILSNFKGTSPQKVIHRILDKLQELLKGEHRFGKYLKQLEVLAKLRNLQEETLKQTADMPIVYDLETDIRFMQGEARGESKGEARGEARGIEKNRIETAKELLLLNVISILQISQITKLPIDRIEAIKKQIING